MAVRCKKWMVYILECNDHTLYVGITNGLAQRLRRHLEGKAARYTRGRLPVFLRYAEYCSSRGSALKREYGIKRLSRNEKMSLIHFRSR